MANRVAGTQQSDGFLHEQEMHVLECVVKRFLCRLLGCHGRAPSAQAQFTIGPVELKTKGVATMLILTDEQKCGLAVAFTTQAGNPATVDGVPAWSVSDATVLTLEVAPDGLSAVITTAGPLGTAQVSVSADADLGEGIETITGVLDVEVRAARAVTVGISAGTPEPK